MHLCSAVFLLTSRPESIVHDTVVLITHDNSIAVKAKRIVRLQDGRIIYDGDAHDPKAVVQPELDEEVGAL